jgi:hypothetical protein
VALGLAAALALLGAGRAAAANCCIIGAHGTVAAGPHVLAASVSAGRLHETLRFRQPGRFVAHILSRQPAGLPLRGREVSLGQRAAGRTHLSIRLGALSPGTYAVVITPAQQTAAANSRTAATWVTFTVTQTRAVRTIKLTTP